ncbi:MFS transporter [Litchfieldia alkalitelluris]|uniref:MFS transporter n=1 Tax=Litchfieldia alkalitelluris TaxID=304268 RepID=UPI000997DC94|nr:MFS transporter [Litchfieldia alkalitelluris]
MSSNNQLGTLTRRQDNGRTNLWELILYPAGAIVSILFLMAMMLVSFYAAGIVGLGTVVASVIITGTRILDSVTDPIMGYIIDRTQGRFGKVSIFLFFGFIIMAVTTLLIYFTSHLVPESIKMIYFIFLYVIFIFGYTFYSVASTAGYSILTRDSSQRPTLGAAAAIYISLVSAIFGFVLSNFLVPKYGGLNNAGIYQELTIWIIVAGAVLTSIALFVIWPKDRVENYGDGNVDAKPLNFREMFSVLKGNRNLQLFIVAAATDKLAMQIKGNQVVGVMLFGIIIGNFALAGQLALIALIPNILFILFGFGFARKRGSKSGLVMTTWMSIFVAIISFLVLWIGDPTQISLTNWGFMTVAFVVSYLALTSLVKLPLAFVTPMIPDIVDYEAYKSGRYVPGVVSSVYSFIDKGVSSLAQTVVGICLAMIGFKAAFPDVNTPYSDSIFWMAMFLNYGILILGWIATLIAMKFYKLDKNKMEEIRIELDKRREKNQESVIEAKAK